MVDLEGACGVGEDGDTASEASAVAEAEVMVLQLV